jgi:hypothetical protein
MFLWGAQIVLREKYIKNYIYVTEPNELLIEILENSSTPFDGFFQTLIACMVPIFNLIYISYYLIIALTKDEEKLNHLRESMRDIKRGM